MFLGGVTSGTASATADDQLTSGPAAPEASLPDRHDRAEQHRAPQEHPPQSPTLHDRILEAEARARQARAEYWSLLAEAQQQPGPSLTRHRNETLWLADSLRIAKGTAGGHCHRGRLLFDQQPRIGQAFINGEINEEHVTLLLRLWNRRELRDAFIEDLDALIGFARNDWATCRYLYAGWETLVDPIDPNEYAERAHDDRSLADSDPVSQQVLIEILSTTAAWAQVEPGLNAKTNELFEADWADARARLGDAATMTDLARSNRQRRHDAFMILMRQGIGADPTLANVTANIVVDDETLLEEAERRDAVARGEEPPARNLAAGEAVARAARRRCETESGMAISPADALDYAIAGHVQLFLMNTPTRDFTASIKTRLFKGALRTGLMIRDRHCQGDGCDTRARDCQADHTVRYEDGGLTEPTNGKPWCKPCHRHKSRLEMLGLWPPGP